MKFVFFGTPEFATIILKQLIEAGMLPATVVCNPDRPTGRKKILTSPPTKVLAEKYSISVFQPETFDISIFKSLNVDEVDFAVVAAYAKIIPKKILDSLPNKFIGVHPSLLPKYRGPTPIQTAILNGEKETGVTLFLMDEKIDRGAILRNEKLEIRNEDNYESLMKRLAKLSADLLIQTLPKFIKGEIRPAPQNDDEATYTKKFTTQDAYVDLEKDDPLMTERKIRALNPAPGVWTLQQIQGKQQRIKILEAGLSNSRLKLKKIQIAGKKPQQI